MDSSILIGGLALGAGLLYYSQTSSAEISGSNAFNPLSINEDGPDKRKQKLENVGGFLSIYIHLNTYNRFNTVHYRRRI